MEKLIIKNKNKIFFIDFKDIISLISCGRYTTIVTEEREYTVCKNLGSLENDLPDHFFRIHNSYVININKILNIHRMEINMCKGLTHKITKGRKKETVDYISRFRDNSS